MESKLLKILIEIGTIAKFWVFKNLKFKILDYFIIGGEKGRVNKLLKIMIEIGIFAKVFRIFHNRWWKKGRESFLEKTWPPSVRGEPHANKVPFSLSFLFIKIVKMLPSKIGQKYNVPCGKTLCASRQRS